MFNVLKNQSHYMIAISVVFIDERVLFNPCKYFSTSLMCRCTVPTIRHAKGGGNFLAKVCAA
jgi:hypothetical protein